MTVLTLTLDPIVHLTDEQFYQLCQANRDLRFERTAEGHLIVMPPTGWDTGERNLEIEGQLWLWNRQTKQGKAFNSCTGFTLPNGADRSPNAAWVRLERIEAINPDPEKFLPLAPDLVVELCSATDNLKRLQQKMQEYIDNGVRLGWLIDPQECTVEIYRSGQAVEVLDYPPYPLWGRRATRIYPESQFNSQVREKLTSREWGVLFEHFHYSEVNRHL